MQKTPYELDLETMDRIPNFTPKAGDYVKIKSLEWYEKWKDDVGVVRVLKGFTESMKHLCGRYYRISLISFSGIIYLNDTTYMFSRQMFEEIIPADSLPDWIKKEEPELQTIKKHRFIKLEKL